MSLPGGGGQVDQEYGNIGPRVKNRRRPQAAGLLHQQAQQQPLDQRDDEKEGQAPAVLDLRAKKRDMLIPLLGKNRWLSPKAARK
jgi:hypothetical protein